MKANPGGTVTGKAIVGRSAELNEIWSKISKRSILLSAERRVGKTSLLRKLQDEPRAGWSPLLVLVESARHPIDCVEAIHQQAEAAQLRSRKGILLKRVSDSYQKLTSATVSGWKLPELKPNWQRLLKDLIEDIVEHADTGAVIMIDEFPLMVWNIADDHGAPLAMQFLDALREIRQQFEPSGKLRFVLCGSIGFHLVLKHLKLNHDYKGAPTNDMHTVILTGMSADDTELMCRGYLDEEKIARNTPELVAERMYQRTDGLPLYIQYVCEAIQDESLQTVEPGDIDRIVEILLNDAQCQWFRDAAQRIEGYYAKFKSDRTAAAILSRLSAESDFFAEDAILNSVRTVDQEVDDSEVRQVIDLLMNDNYLIRDTSTGSRRYRFRYRLMREWWKINRA